MLKSFNENKLRNKLKKQRWNKEKIDKYIKQFYTEKDIKAIKVLKELVLIDDSKMCNKLIRWYLAKIKKIYNL